MHDNTAKKPEQPRRREQQTRHRRPRRIPGISSITSTELEILDRLAPPEEALARILTLKAVLGGEICGWYRERDTRAGNVTP